MWGLTAEAAADWIANHGGWSNYPSQQSDGPRQRSYLCRACQVHGIAPDDDSLACWLCGSTDDLTMDKGPCVTSPSTYRAGATYGDYGPLEEVAILVG